MDDRVEPFPAYGARHGLGVADVRAEEFDLPAHGLEVVLLDARVVVVREAVEHGDAVPGGEQGFDQMRADEARAAGDENFHRDRSRERT